MLATKSENIEIAYKEKKWSMQKAIRDYNYLIYQSKQEGIKEGLEKGAYSKVVETSKNFLKLGLKPQMIAEGTRLSIEEVNQIQEDMGLNVRRDYE